MIPFVVSALFGRGTVSGSIASNTRVPRGDMQSGGDRRIPRGDMQSGSDVRKTRDTI